MAIQKALLQQIMQENDLKSAGDVYYIEKNSVITNTEVLKEFSTCSIKL